eukprot:1161140-Pelagomonas_calceolata.AAC.9
MGGVAPASSEEAGSKIWMIVLEAQLRKAVHRQAVLCARGGGCKHSKDKQCKDRLCCARGLTAASKARTGGKMWMSVWVT